MALFHGPNDKINERGVFQYQVAPHNEPALVPHLQLEANDAQTVLRIILHRKERRLLVKEGRASTVLAGRV